MSEIRLGQRRVKLPKGRFWRVCLGVILLLGGIVGFLPVVGFWMAPLGIMVLSIDFPAVRKFKRRNYSILFCSGPCRSGSRRKCKVVIIREYNSRESPAPAPIIFYVESRPIPRP